MTSSDPPRRRRDRSVSPRPFPPAEVSDREQRLRAVEKCTNDVRSRLTLIGWLLALIVPGALGGGAYVVSQTITTTSRLDTVERAQERQETASATSRADVRTMQSKVSELATEIRLSREAQRADAEEMKEALIRLEDRLARRGR